MSWFWNRGEEEDEYESEYESYTDDESEGGSYDDSYESGDESGDESEDESEDSEDQENLEDQEGLEDQEYETASVDQACVDVETEASEEESFASDDGTMQSSEFDSLLHIHTSNSGDRTAMAVEASVEASASASAADPQSSPALAGVTTATTAAQAAGKTTTERDDSPMDKNTHLDEHNDHTEQQDGDGSEEQQEVTTLEEQRSMLQLAAEHDRVDILQTILQKEGASQQALLNPDPSNTTPPLHTACSCGSVNAVNCLLRMGADPSLRVEDEGKSAWDLAKTAKNRMSLEHAFLNEALRCLGGDEVDRLKSLLEAGLPASATMGFKTLSEWCVDWEATACADLLDGGRKKQNTETVLEDAPPVVRGFVMRDKQDLQNRADELASLAKALSTCLDNLAEEVSVCTGLLLVNGNGGIALASHVRSLKALRERKLEALARMQEAYEQSQDELAYWAVHRGYSDGQLSEEEYRRLERIATKTTPETTVPFANTTVSDSEDMQASGSSTTEEESNRHQLSALISTTETKIRSLRAAIADLSEEQERNLEAVQQRGLTGGITLVRQIRDEIRQVDFELTEVTNAEGNCQAKVKVLQAAPQRSKDENELAREERTGTAEVVSSDDSQKTPEDERLQPSEKIAKGQSTAIVVHEPYSDNNRGLLTLWQILLRIMGLSNDLRNGEARPAMIV